MTLRDWLKVEVCVAGAFVAGALVAYVTRLWYLGLLTSLVGSYALGWLIGSKGSKRSKP